MEFKTAFATGIAKAEERAGQPSPAHVLDKFVADLHEASNGALKLQLVECPSPRVICVPAPLRSGYAVLVERSIDGHKDHVPVCAVNSSRYSLELRWGIMLNWYRPCRDSGELVRNLQHALEDDAVASLLRQILAEPKIVKAAPMEWIIGASLQASDRLKVAQ